MFIREYEHWLVRSNTVGVADRVGKFSGSMEPDVWLCQYFRPLY